MATTSTASSPSTLLRLPAPIRQKIYTYLLAPHADEDVTTINYTLNWNWFENPSNTTFTGLQQIDLCRCPQQHYRTHNTATEDHIYERYKCHGPKVRFKSAREDLWVLSAGYTRSGQINFLRPATEMELEWRPCGNILSTCRMVYQEAVPILYRGRNFLFLTGPCPRGRYQAYATQMFLSRLTPLARSHVTTLSIIAQNYEEDCRVNDTGGAYANLATYIEQSLPAFQTLCFNLWDERLKDLACLLCGVFVKKGASICFAMDPISGRVVHCKDPESFGVALQGVVMREHRDARDVQKALPNTADDSDAKDEKDRNNTDRCHGGTAWEEIDADEDVWAVQPRPRPEVRNRHIPRGVTRVQRVIFKSRDKGKGKVKQEVQEEEDDDWIDATLSPSSVDDGKDGDTESWEML